MEEIIPLAFRLRRRAEAARYAVIAAEKKSEDPLLLGRLAAYLASQEDFPRALKLYEKAIELRSDKLAEVQQLLLHLETGRLQLLAGDFKKSANTFTRVRDLLAPTGSLSLERDDVKKVLGEPARTYSLMAESFLRAGRLDDARTMFERANQIKPNDGLLAWRLARIEDARGDPDAALKQLEHCFQAKLASAGDDPYQLLAKLLRQLQDDELAARRELIQRLEACRRDDPSNAALGYYLAGRLLESDALERAERLYGELLKAKPDIEGYRGLVEVRRRRGELDPLLDALGEMAAETASLQPLGQVFETLAADKALTGRLLERARQRLSDSAPPLNGGALLAAALLAIESQEFAAADRFFEPALQKLASSKAQVLINWGLELLLARQYERAAQVFGRAIAEGVATDKNPTLYLQQASALEQADKVDEAIEAARRASALAPDSSRVRGALAMILYREKRQEAEQRIPSAAPPVRRESRILGGSGRHAPSPHGPLQSLRAARSYGRSRGMARTSPRRASRSCRRDE